MLTLVLTVIASQAAPAPAATPQAAVDPAAVIENPSWVRHPQMRFNRTTRASSGGVPNGRVIVQCTANTEGRLEDCHVVSDTSSSNRLSPYALRAARDAIIRPRLIDGMPVAAEIRFSIGVTSPQ